MEEPDGPPQRDHAVRQQASIARFGLQALSLRTLPELFEHAVQVLAETLDIPMCGFMQAEIDGTFTFMAGVGWKSDMVGARIPAEPHSAIAAMLAAARPLLYDDLEHETRFAPPTLLLDYGVRSGAGVVVHGRDGPLGVIGIHSFETRRFTDGEADFMQAIANVLSEAMQRTRAEEQAKLAYQHEHEVAQQLRALDRLKNEFLQAVSHELRTPLATVLGVSLTLRAHVDRLPTNERDDLLQSLERNARRLDRLLEDLLDTERLAKGMIEPTLAPTELSELIADVIDQHRERHGIHYRCEPIIIDLDPPKVERIVDNLIRNAIRHTPPDTKIWVRLERSNGGALITVEDDGPGIDPLVAPRLFEPFVRGDQQGKHIPGTGIGLTLVARFAALHGGHATVEPRSGGGTSFKVWLPDHAQGVFV